MTTRVLEPEVALRIWLSSVTRLSVDDPKVIELATQIAAVQENGYGSLTVRFRDGVLYLLEAQIPTIVGNLTRTHKSG